MKTANEMVTFCRNNGYGRGMGWDTKHFTIIEQALSSDEDVLMCFVGVHNYVSMTNHDGNYAYALTNKRMICGQHKALGQNLRTILYDNLNDITFQSGIAFGGIVIDTIKETIKVQLDKQAAKRISDVIHGLLYDLKNKKSAAASMPSAADEIKKLKELLDIGVINQAEFDAKKKQLLGI